MGNKILAIFNIEGTYHALDGMCAHQGGPLAEGQIDGSVITCPWHGWQYDIPTGQHCLNDRITQSKYIVEAEGNDLYVDLG